MRPVRAIHILFLLLPLGLVGCTRPAVEPAPRASAPAAAPLCSKPDSAATAQLADLTPIGEQCGGIVCRPGLHCCNPSCNTCTPRGVECTQQSCN